MEIFSVCGLPGGAPSLRKVLVVFPDALHGSVSVPATVFDTPELRSQGLKGWSALPTGFEFQKSEGALFVFPDEKPRRFTMAGVGFPIDVVFIDETGVIRQIVRSAPALSPDPIPSVPAAWAVELPAMFTDYHGIKVEQRMKVG